MFKSMRACVLTSWVLLAIMGIGFLAVPVAIGQDDVAAETAVVEVTAPTEVAVSDQEGAYSSEEFMASEGYATFAVNNLWICISAALVFIMHLGFTTVEAGLTQKKNAVNIIFKNYTAGSIRILNKVF